jgi:hypothetical protein
MPKTLDLRQIKITHDPNQKIIQELPRVPEFVPPLLSGALALVQQIIDALVQGFYGWTETGFGADALRTVTNAIGVGLGALNHLVMRIEALEGKLVAAIEDFAKLAKDVVSALDPNKWLQVVAGSGGGFINVGPQGYAVFQPLEDTVNRVAAAIHKKVAESDFLKVSTVISTPASVGASVGRQSASNTILARVDNANPLSNNVFAKLNDNTATVGFVRDGVTTVLGTVNNVLKNGSTYTLDVTEARTFVLLENSRPVLTVVDAAAKSALGSAFRSTGFGTIAPNATSRPGVVASFASFLKGP